MITAIQITGVKFDVDDKTKRYVERKIGRLDRFLPRHARKTVTAEVVLRTVNRPRGNKYEAEVILKVPDKSLTAKDSTMSALAAIDIVEAKLANQLRKYKQSRMPQLGKSRQILSRFKRSYQREQ